MAPKKRIKPTLPTGKSISNTIGKALDNGTKDVYSQYLLTETIDKHVTNEHIAEQHLEWDPIGEVYKLPNGDVVSGGSIRWDGIVGRPTSLPIDIDKTVLGLPITDADLRAHILRIDLHLSEEQIARILLLANARGNIQQQIDAMSNMFNNTFIRDTRAELDLIADLANQDVGYVRADETKVGEFGDFYATMYIFSEGQWEFITILSPIIRNFLLDPLDLETESTGEKDPHYMADKPKIAFIDDVKQWIKDKIPPIETRPLRDMLSYDTQGNYIWRDSTITTPTQIFVDVNNDDLDSLENGSINNPFTTIQKAIDAAGFGATIIIAAGTYNENIVIDSKENVTLTADATIGQRRVIVTGNLSIGGNSTRIGIRNVHINGNYSVTSTRGLIYIDNFSVGGVTNLNSTDYHRYDDCYFHNVFVKGTVFAELRGCQCENNSTWTIDGSPTATLYCTGNMNAKYVQTNGSLIIINDINILPVFDNAGIVSTSNVGVLWVDGLNFLQSNMTYASVQKTGTCPLVWGLNQFNPDNSVLTGAIFYSGILAKQVFIDGIDMETAFKNHLANKNIDAQHVEYIQETDKHLLENGEIVATESFIEQYVADQLLNNSAPTGFGLGSAAVLATGNWNNFALTGWYRGQNLLNSPGPGWWYVMVIRSDANNIAQQAFSLDQGTRSMLTRRCQNGTWTAWEEIADRNYVINNFAPAGFGLGGAAQSVTGDWNTHVKTGFYMGTGLINSPTIIPTVSSWFYVRSIQHDATHVIQQAWSFSSNRTCIRTLNSTWSAWVEIANTTHIDLINNSLTNNVRVMQNVARFTTGAATIGTVQLKLPSTLNVTSILNIEMTVSHRLSSTEMVKVLLQINTFNWTATGYDLTIIGADNEDSVLTNIRLAKTADDKFAILFGAMSTNWTYLTLTVDKVSAPIGGTAVDFPRDGWTISVLANETGLTNILQTVPKIVIDTKYIADTAHELNVNGVYFKDTRDVADTPGDLMAKGRLITAAFKRSASVGNPPVNAGVAGYNHIVNFTGYTDASGGYPTQISIGQGLAVRKGKSATEWNDWIKFAEEGFLAERGLLGTNKDISGADLNTLKTTGFFMGSSLVNAPFVSANWFYVVCQRHTSSYCTQEATYFNDGRKWTRVLYANVWSEWKLITTASINGTVVGSQTFQRYLGQFVPYEKGKVTISFGSWWGAAATFKLKLAGYWNNTPMGGVLEKEFYVLSASADSITTQYVWYSTVQGQLPSYVNIGNFRKDSADGNKWKLDIYCTGGGSTIYVMAESTFQNFSMDNATIGALVPDDTWTYAYPRQYTNFVPGSDNTTDLGTSALRFKNTYLVNNPTVGSDRRIKRNIEDIPDSLAIALISKLKPKQYNRVEDESNKVYYGFIAQEVEELLQELGLDPAQIGFLVKEPNENGEDFYSLQYGEFTALQTKVIQILLKKIT